MRLLVQQQDRVHQGNYETFLRRVVDTCPEVYAADTPQGDLVRLANLKVEEPDFPA